MGKFLFDASQEYERLNDLIKKTSTHFDRLVSGQGAAAPLQHVRWMMYLCLVRQVNKQGQCYSVRWAKYRVSETGRRTWYNGWIPGKIPASVKQHLEPADSQKILSLDQFAKELSKVRKDLTTKKKRIRGTFQSIQKTEKPHMERLWETARWLEKGRYWEN